MKAAFKALAFLTVLAFAAGIFFLNGLADVRPIAERTECQKRLTTIYAALQTYLDEHSDFPRDEAGNFSLKPLLCETQPGSGCVTAEHLHCNLKKHPPAEFLCAKGLGSDEAKSISLTRTHNPFVLICHDTGSLHQGYLGMFMMSDGSVLTISNHEGAYVDWLKNKFIPATSPIPAPVER